MKNFFKKRNNKNESIAEKIEDKYQDAKLAKDDIVFWWKGIWDFTRNHWKKVLIAIPTLFFLLWWALAWLIQTNEILTITDKETKITGVEIVYKLDKKTGKKVEVQQNTDTYFIYTNKRAFQFHPSKFFLQWEVADRFGQLEVGKTYEITHYGFRVALFDWYENIVDFKLIEEPVQKVKVVNKVAHVDKTEDSKDATIETTP